MEDRNILDASQLDPALINEINRIGARVYLEELQAAFIQAAAEVAYYEAISPAPRGFDGRDRAAELDDLATQYAAERLAELDFAHTPGLISRPLVAGGKRMQDRSDAMVTTHERDVLAAPLDVKMLAGPFGRDAGTVAALAGSWAENVRVRERVQGRLELVRQQKIRDQEREREQAFKRSLQPDATRERALERNLAHQRQVEAKQRLEAQRRIELQRKAQEAAKVQERTQAQERLAKQRRDLEQREKEQRRIEEQRERTDVERWNDRAAAEAYARVLRAQTEIARGGDPQYWEAYALRDRSMTLGLRRPGLATDGHLNGATTQQYQVPVSGKQTQLVRAEAQEHESSSEARIATGYGLESSDRNLERHQSEHDFGPVLARDELKRADA